MSIGFEEATIPSFSFEEATDPTPQPFTWEEAESANPPAPTQTKRSVGEDLARRTQIFRSAGPLFKNTPSSVDYVNERMPFSGGFYSAARNVKVMNAANRIKEGTHTDDDLNEVAGFLAEQHHESQKGTAQKVFDTVSQLPGFAIEFTLTGGGYTATREATKKGLQKVIGKTAEKMVGKAAIAATSRLAGVAAQTALNPQLIAKNTSVRMLPQFEQYASPTGEVESIEVGADGERFLQALPKAYLDSMIELGSERAGGHILKGLGFVGSKIPYITKVTAVKNAIAKRWLAAKPGRTITDLYNKTATAAGWNGVVGEVLEERAGDVGRLATGLEAPHENVTGQLLSGDHDKAMEQLLVEGLAFSVPGASVNIASRFAPTETSTRLPDAATWTQQNLEMAKFLADKVAAGESISRKDFEKAGLKSQSVGERTGFARQVLRVLNTPQAQQQPEPVAEEQPQPPAQEPTPQQAPEPIQQPPNVEPQVEQPPQAPVTLPGPQETTPPPTPAPPSIEQPPTQPPPAPPPATKPPRKIQTPDQLLAHHIADLLNRGVSLNAQQFFEMADIAYGGTRAAGKYGPSDAYDALENGINQYLLGKTNPQTDATQAKAQISELDQLLSRVPSQTNRSGEKDAFQQFSTPPAYAYAATWLANIQPGETVLEPSAGVGGIAIHAKNAGASTFANEWSKRRAGLLGTVGLNGVFTEDAEQLHNIMPGRMTAPSVIVMNPPFSHAANRMGLKKIIGTDLKHVDAALQFLAPGGRLVAIIGAPLHGGETQTFTNWFRGATAQYNVRANVTLDRGVYKGYGTTFPTRVLVIDKTGATPTGSTITGQAASLAELVDKLEAVRNDRIPATQPQLSQPEVQGNSAPTEGVPGPGLSVQPPASDLGTDQSGTPGPVEGLPPEPPAASGSDAGVETEPSPTPVDATSGGERLPGRRGLAKPGRGSKGGGGRSGGSTGGKSSGGTPATGDTTTGPGLEQPTTEPTVEQPPTEQPPVEQPPAPAPEQIEVENRAPASKSAELTEDVFSPYVPSNLHIPGAKPHPGSIVESAAMASVEAPDVTYRPTLPKAVIEQGQLSDIQLEAVTYAGQAHQTMLPENKEGVSHRQGYMVGDGTGVGKGRIVSGIVLDNWMQGRKKAVWVSKNSGLLASAKRDWKGLGQDPGTIIQQAKIKSGEKVAHGNGIMFTTYGTMRSDASTAAKAKGNDKSRVQQIVDWVGPDFDGVIAFDESHEMAGAVPAAGGRGDKKPSQQGLAGLELQAALPKARVVYVSATSATEVHNLAYADRLGLWGKGTEFDNVMAFISKIADGGVAAMELVARDMKALGKYLARSLSFNDGTPEGTVDYDRLEHTLTPEQRAVYDKLAEAWQVTLNNFEAALGMTGGASNGRAVSAARSAYWSAHQRFFNQVITSMQVPSVLASIQRDLDAGKSVVIQLTNTGEAAQDRALAKREEGDDLADFDSSPADVLIQMVETSFPTGQFETFIDENGRPQTRPVKDSNGNLVQNAQAVAAKNALLDQLSSIAVPNSPLDTIIDHFGHENVAEVTGRSRRVILMENERGERKKVENNRTKGFSNQAEISAFQDGKKRILLFSEAGGTGASYHADRAAKNQQKRMHYLLQAGWKAAAAIQGLGRSHRTNQAQAPTYILVHTNLKGQKRFLSTIARRLSQLGALTKGQRQTGSSGVFAARDNLEGREAQDAMKNFFRDLVNGNVETIGVQDFEQQTGLKLRDQYGQPVQNFPDVRSFLNRLLSMKVDLQNAVFDEFDQRLGDVIRRAEADGSLDVGVENLVADQVQKVSEKVAYTEPTTGAKTKYVKLKLFNKTVPIPYQKTFSYNPLFFVTNKAGKIFAVEKSDGHRTDEKTGAVHAQYRLRPPGGSTKYEDVEKFGPQSENYTEVKPHEVQPLWETAIANLPKYQESNVHMLTGVLLPIWNRLHGNTQVKRTITNEGEQLLGRVIPASQVNRTLQALGVKQEGGPEIPSLTPEQAAAAVLDDGAVLKLANGWTIKRARVQNEERIEITGPNFTNHADLDSDGVTREKIASKMRYFIPVGENAAKVLGKVIKSRPIIEATGLTSEHAMAAQPEGEGTKKGLRATRGAPEIPVDVEDRGGKTNSAHQIIATMGEMFDVPIRTGRIAMRKALGIFKEKAEVIRTITQASADLAVLSHEVAHKIDKKYKARRARGLTGAMRQELKNLDYEPTAQRASEGFAEFIRHFLTTGEAATHAPLYHQFFVNEWLPKHPDLQAKIERARSLIDQWRTAGSQARVESAINEKGEPAQPIEPFMRRLADQLRNGWNRFYAAGKSELHAMRLFDVASQEQGYKLSEGENWSRDLAGAFSQSARSMAARATEHGVFNLTDGTRTSAGLREIMGPINEAEYDQWRRFAIARHALEVYKKTPEKNPGIARVDARQVYDEVAADPQRLARYTAAADGLREFNAALVNMLADAGVITTDSAAKIIDSWETYLPLLRVVQKKGFKKFGGNMVDMSGSPIKKRHGSGAQILDPVESTVQYAIQFYSRAIEQQIDLQMVHQADPQLGGAEGMGGWIERVPPKKKVTRIGGQEVVDAISQTLKKMGLGVEADQFVDALGDLLAEDYINIWRPEYKSSPGEHIRRLIVNGQPVLYQFDPDLYAARTGLHSIQVPSLMGILTAFAKLQRLTTTGINTFFALNNIVNDWQDYQFQAKEAGPESVASPFYWTALYIKSELVRMGMKEGMEDQTIRLWKELNGDLATRVGLDRDSLKKLRKEILAHDKPQHLKNLMWHPIDTARDIITVSDVGPRLSEFAATLRRHGYVRQSDGQLMNTTTGEIERPPRNVLIDAINAANDATVNFKNKGWAVKWIDQFIPFTNARIEGLDRRARQMGLAYRGAKNIVQGKPVEADEKAAAQQLAARAAKRLTLAMAISATAGVLHWLLRHDDDDYKAQEDWLHGWWTFTDDEGDPVLRIPRGHEWDFPATFTEALLDSVERKNAARLAGTLNREVMKAMPGGPSGVQPAIESYFNWDFFRQRPIESEGMQKYLPEDRGRPYNTELMKAIGGWLGVSPAKLEHFVNSTTGGAYQRWMGTAERAYNTAKDNKGAKLSSRDIPFIGAWVMRKDYPADVNDFYQERDDLEQQYNSAKLHGKLTDELANRYHQFEDYAELMTEIGAPIRNETDRDKRFEAEKYIVGLSRAALGREELERYPNPLKKGETDVPKSVVSVRRKYIERLHKRLKESAPKRKLGEKKDKFAARMQDHRRLRTRTTTVLRQLAESSE